ncbi:MAG: SDR family NAD(P)-dependent oxidoreductase [Actinobacteria bacterium]|nr:SDR family NAD(P)-dependent oxidoreductase [Actinomycetota bacterium]MCB8995997.1 SDR family NAD(P)-dependent oxidoreductase [Actinomycetota bacterium]MCB9415297.1 SDR family NAD(P)-dependent oxidoreductase [Actinomycetota bacterium]MCB9424112.1 SDR family NAD(P)-dependent oxidoreductase [Actinomycetota bacterium]HRY09944.1 SDR family NAD(P)-dependent oxidoreductase [Candidatus Nanopelagicales bacterium]
MKDLIDSALEFSVAGSFSRIGYWTRSRLEGWEPPPGLAGRRILLTGGSSGVGLAAARMLNEAGARLVVTGRDRDKLETAVDALGEVGERPLPLVADSSDLDQVRAGFDRAVAHLGGLDVLINNAGALVDRYRTTPQGYEQTYAVHVLSSFVLTEQAVGVMGPEGRVLTVSSGGMYSQSLQTDMQAGEKDFDGVRAYAKAKRAQVALTQEWARRYPEGPFFAVMHPGWADTPGVRTSLPTFRRVTGPILRTPEQGADTLVWLVSARVPSGRFWLDRRERTVLRVPGTRHSDDVAAQLWDRVAADAAGLSV